MAVTNAVLKTNSPGPMLAIVSGEFRIPYDKIFRLSTEEIRRLCFVDACILTSNVTTCDFTCEESGPTGDLTLGDYVVKYAIKGASKDMPITVPCSEPPMEPFQWNGVDKPLPSDRMAMLESETKYDTDWSDW